MLGDSLGPALGLELGNVDVAELGYNMVGSSVLLVSADEALGSKVKTTWSLGATLGTPSVVPGVLQSCEWLEKVLVGSSVAFTIAEKALGCRVNISCSLGAKLGRTLDAVCVVERPAV
jgi:hypothetical protein